MKTHGLQLVAAALIGIAGLGVGPSRAADLRLMVEPIYTPERAAEVYKPLVDYLDKATGHRFELVTPRNYHFFWRELRTNTPVDFMLAEPHLTDYRITRFGAIPLVRTAEKTRYSLLVSDTIENPSLESLVGRSIVTMPSPSLGFALLLEFYPNPVAQPNILSAATSWRDGVEIVFAGEADAAIVPTWLEVQYPNLPSLVRSREFPGTALTAAANVDPAIREAVSAALLKLHEDPALYEVLNELGITRFEPATASEYRGYETMLKGFFGYEQ